jgi:hypothetical protein
MSLMQRILLFVLSYIHYIISYIYIMYTVYLYIYINIQLFTYISYPTTIITIPSVTSPRHSASFFGACVCDGTCTWPGSIWDGEKIQPIYCW